MAADDKYRLLFETMRQGYVRGAMVYDAAGRAVDYRVLEVNAQYEALTGIPAARAVGRRATEIIPDMEQAWVDTYERLVRTGEPVSLERRVGSLDRWFEVQAYPLGGAEFQLLFEDISDRKRVEEAIRESEQRKAYLLSLSDALRPLQDSQEITRTATRELGVRLGTARSYYVEYPAGRDYAEVARDYHAPPYESMAGRYSNEQFRTTVERIAEGTTWVVEDAQAEPYLQDSERAYFAEHKLCAWIDVPLIKHGELQAALCIVHDEPRRWTDNEITIVEETAERCWAAIERARAQRELALSEERLRALVAAGSLSIYRLSADWSQMIQVGDEPPAPTDRPVDNWLDRYILEEDRPRVLAAIAEGIRSKSPFMREHRVRLDDGSIGWIQSRAVPCFDEDGNIVEWFGAGTDVTDRKRAEIALRKSEQKYRDLFHAMDEAFALVEVIPGEDGGWRDVRFLEVNPAFMTHTGMADPTGKTLSEALGSPNPNWVQLYGRALDTGEPIRVEEQEGTLGRTFDLNFFALDAKRRRVAALFTDITERKRGERRQQMLLAELQHRVRNIMAMIRSVVRRAAVNKSDVGDFVDHLEGRLDAMARTQAMLTRAPGRDIDLASIIEDEMLAQGADSRGLRLRGPGIALSPKVAEVMTLAVHELATNSVKYGALGPDGGQLSVEWKLRRKNGEAQLHFAWEERGITPPAERHPGFGTELITRKIPFELDGAARMDIGPDGICVTLAFPLSSGASVFATDGTISDNAA